jgi:hypothetical protein
MVAVILQPLFAALVPRPSLAHEAEAARPPAHPATVLLAAVAAQAHEEPLAAKRAEELELRGLLVHPSNADGRELDAAAGASDKEPFSLSASASRAPGANRGPSPLLAVRAADLHRDTRPSEFSAASTSTVSRRRIQPAVYRGELTEIECDVAKASRSGQKRASSSYPHGTCTRWFDSAS